MKQGLVAGGAALAAAFGIGVLLTVLQWGVEPGARTADVVTIAMPGAAAHSGVADPGLKEAPRVLR
jgi:anaerobic C4-dicarboxylate transporter